LLSPSMSVGQPYTLISDVIKFSGSWFAERLFLKPTNRDSS
jgi:hypothetical protein